MFDDDLATDTNNGDDGSKTVSDRPLPRTGGLQRPESDHADVYAILRELEELPDKATRLLIGSILIGFDHRRFHDLVLKMRANLPSDVRVARRITRDQDKIVGQAKQQCDHLIAEGQSKADELIANARSNARELMERAQLESERIIAEAEIEAQKLVSESQVVQVARTQAKEILHRAGTEAEDMRLGASDYASDVLTNLATALERAHEEVERGRKRLEDVRVELSDRSDRG